MKQSTCMMDKSAVDIQKLKKEWASDKPFPLCFSLKETLPKTYIEPLPFWSALFEAIAPSLSSNPFETYPLYDDCVTRHLDANPIALKILGETEKSWTYREIDTKVTQALPFLRTLGPTISLPLSHSLDFLILFLGAIKLGKTLNFLSPATQLVYDENSFDEETPSHVYQARDPLFIHGGYSLDVNTAFLCSLRDGFFHLQLKQEATYARPLTPILDDEPAATLAALLAGATLIYSSHPDKIAEHGVDVLGVCPALQKHWTLSPNCPSNKLKLWYKTPLYGTIHDTPNFVLLNQLEKIPQAELLFEPLRGGITLASRPHDPQNILHPNFGIPYSLLQLNDCGEEALDGIGYFHLNPPREDTLILSTLKEGFWLSYSKNPLREGRPFPIDTIETLALTHPDVHSAVISVARDPRDIHGSLFTLVLFTSPDANPFDITPQLPQEFLPDHIVTVPLYPRRLRGTFHRALTLSEFEQGNFYLKRKLPAYHYLSCLRHSIQEAIC